MTRGSERRKAWRLRQKPVLTPTEREWLDTYEATLKRPPGNPEPADPPADDPAPGPEEQAGPAPPVEPIPPPPPPPRVPASSSGPSSHDDDDKASNWRSKYKRENGRERAVLAIASQWKSILDFLSHQITLSGGTPVVDTAMLWQSLVITVDDVLPERFELRPQHIAALGTTALLAQRIARHKKVVAAYEQQAAAQATGQSPAPPPTQPTPPISQPGPPAPDAAPEPVSPVVRLSDDIATQARPDVY